jgi:hypothetical protein
MAAPLPTTVRTAVLDDLLAECRRFSVEFGPTLANHLPMVLVALARLGASDRRLRQYFAHYRDTNQLRPAPADGGRIGHGNWREHRGDRDLEGDYRAFFAGEVRRLGAAAAERAYLPELVTGVGASALHALMRLAYAEMTDSEAEIALTLGYWAATYLPLAPAAGAAPATDDPADVLQRLRFCPGLLEIAPESDLLWHAMRAVGRDPRFAPVIDWLAIDQRTLPRMAGASLVLFAATMDFCALHAVTGSHWIRLIPADRVDRALLIRHFWQAIAAVYPKMGLPALPDETTVATMRAAPCPPWPEIAAKACASDDEHDHSLVFSAWQEEQAYGDPLYRRVAARRVGLIA